jgi:hypothetical protein
VFKSHDLQHFEHPLHSYSSYRIWPEKAPYIFRPQQLELNPLLLREGRKVHSSLQPIEAECAPGHFLEDYNPPFVDLVRGSSFIEYFKVVINPHWLVGVTDIDREVERMLSFQKAELNRPLLRSNGVFVKESIISFGSILKLLGLKKSRYDEKDNLLNLLYLCSGIYKDPNTAKIIKVEERVRICHELLDKYKIIGRETE